MRVSVSERGCVRACPGARAGGRVSGRRPLSQGGPGRAVVAGGSAAGGVAPMAVPEGKRRAAAVAVPCSPRAPLAGPVPAAAFPSAVCELRRGRGGSAGGPVIPRTHRDRRPSGALRPAGLGVSAGALRSFRPGLNNAAGAARVWESRRRGRGCLCWAKGACGSSPSSPLPAGSRAAPLEGLGWDRGDRRGTELSGLRARAVTAELCAALCSPRVCAVPVLNVEGVGRALLRRCTSVHPEVCSQCHAALGQAGFAYFSDHVVSVVFSSHIPALESTFLSESEGELTWLWQMLLTICGFVSYYIFLPSSPNKLVLQKLATLIYKIP
ncbi:protein-L-isoaspartate(D-aspartate) O-methyltransferase isoform X1 [Passer montanus]|uniref:protein-L-isoaspartate(D-aspartate) O-methyltransferase isoform X1 n=1 Tax=Passer montanus TaxID=9160 RepID=UPI001961A36C|nr:protein-L-isoaspartate(D-aspartate) O-methyltransferase isoform X1 [Passer montanus]